MECSAFYASKKIGEANETWAGLGERVLGERENCRPSGLRPYVIASGRGQQIKSCESLKRVPARFQWKCDTLVLNEREAYLLRKGQLRSFSKKSNCPERSSSFFDGNIKIFENPEWRIFLNDSDANIENSSPFEKSNNTHFQERPPPLLRLLDVFSKKVMPDNKRGDKK